EEDTPSPFIRFQAKKKQVEQMQKVLEVKEEDFKKLMKVISCRWRDVHAKEAQMKIDIKESEKTLKENDRMRIQALKKAIKEREKRREKKIELLRAKEKLETLRKRHQKLCTTVQKYSIFNKYLEDVVRISQFEGIREVILRYKTLLRIRMDLLRTQYEHKELSEQDKVLLDLYVQEKEAEVLEYKNELVQLQLRLDQARSDILSWENQWDDIQSTIDKKTQELGAIKLSILNLFQ
ncbi:CCD42 protein, partial [Turnix velox]|nr:CCD42 protein [Turnix velox]